MAIKRIIGMAAILVLAFASIGIAHQPYEKRGDINTVRGSSAPASPVHGQLWMRSSDNKMFAYDTTYSEWLSIEEDKAEFGNGSPTSSGFLFYASQAQADTSSASSTGAYFGYRTRVSHVAASAAAAPASIAFEMYTSKNGTGLTATLSSYTWDNAIESTVGDWSLAAGDTVGSDQTICVNIGVSAADPSVLIIVRERVAP